MKVHIRLSPTGEGRYVAEVAELPGCRCSGASREQAQDRVREHMYGYLAALGNYVPARLDEEIIEDTLH